MKWFVIVAAFMGTYFWFLVTTTNLMVNQTMQLHQRYQTVAAQADQIANGNH